MLVIPLVILWGTVRERAMEIPLVTATAILRASEAPVAPVEFSAVERNVRKWIGDAKGKLDTALVIAELDKLAPVAAAYEKALAANPALDGARLKKLNAILIQAEQALTRPKGLPQRPWYQNQMAAPGLYTGYGFVTLPGVNESLELGRKEEAQAGVAELAAALANFRGVAEQALAVIQ